MRAFKKHFYKLIECVESESTSLAYYFLAFAAILFLRNFLESFSQSVNYFNFEDHLFGLQFIHFNLSYLELVLAIALVLFIVMKTVPFIKVLKASLIGFGALLITPIFNLLLTKGQGENIYYYLPQLHINLFHSYLTYFGSYSGVTFGLRFEIFCALVTLFIYCLLKTSSWWRSVLASWLVYTLIFIYGCSPVWLKFFVNALGFPFAMSNLFFIHYYLLAITVLGLFSFYFINKSFFVALTCDSRWLRYLHYLLFCFLGSVVAATQSFLPWADFLAAHPLFIINEIFLALSLFFAMQFCIVTNNLQDKAIDQVSNPRRPYLRSDFPLFTYHFFAVAAFFVAVVFAYALSFKALFVIILFMATYSLYSLPPFRIKRIPLFSKLVIGLNSLALFLLGYIMRGADITQVPPLYYYLIIIGVSLAANFIDLKDYRGDALVGIKTLPVLLGMRRAQYAIAVFFTLTTLTFYWIIPVVWLLPVFIGCALLQAYFLMRKDYVETPVMLMHLLGLLTLLFLLTFLQR